MSYKFTDLRRVGEALLNSRVATGLWSAPARHGLFALFLAGILAYGAAFAWYLSSNFDLVHLTHYMNHDDAFYYYQIAYHLAEGKFSTFDGGITQTNGYHPIWMLLITPFYWIFDKEAALFGIKSFEIMLLAGGAALIAAAARLARLPWILLFATLPLLYQYHHLLRGLESAAGVFILGLFFLVCILYARNPARWRWPLAAVAFALPWVRLEYAAISLSATVAWCVIEWSRQERPAGVSLRKAISATPPRTLVPVIGAIIGILAYFAYNGLVFGGIVPVSGATKLAWARFGWEQEGGYSLAQGLQNSLQLSVFDFELLVALVVCAGVPLVWWSARRSGDQKDWLLLAFLVCIFGLAAGHLAMFAQSVLTIHPTWGHHFLWYFAPAYLMMSLVVPVSCYVAIHFVRRFTEPRRRQAVNVLSAGIVVVSAIFLFARADFAGSFRLVNSVSDSTNGTGVWAAGPLVMNRVLPGDSVVGSWDAGITGYFSDFPVVNLDGLVNSYDYFHATNVDRDGYAGWNRKLQPIYREFGITHFANVAEPHFYDQDNLLYTGLPLTRGVWFNVWSADPLEDADPAAWFWQRMEPHFAYQWDGVGLIVDGRLAPAFARDCSPDEVIAWRWTGQGDGPVARSWAQTQTGLCVGALVLPRDALPPVRAEAMPTSDYLAQLVGDNSPAIRADFDVYLVANRLIYTREQCGEADTEAPFFLHLDPVARGDLPARRQLYGFDNLDFRFAERVRQFGATCFIVRELPDYDIAEIRTGQYVSAAGGSRRLWEGVIRPD